MPPNGGLQDHAEKSLFTKTELDSYQASESTKTQKIERVGSMLQSTTELQPAKPRFQQTLQSEGSGFFSKI